MGLNSDDISQLYQIFQNKNWDYLFKAQEIDPFGSFVMMFERLDEEEIKLILTLLNDYIFFDANRFQPCFTNIFNEIGTEILLSYEKIILAPLKKSHRTKSSSSVQYAARNALKRILNNSGKFYSFDTFEAVQKETGGRKDSIIILIDDYIGSGRSAQKAHKDFTNNYAVKSDEIFIAALHCMRQGAEYLNKKGIEVWSLPFLGKGISDSTNIADVQKALDIMIKISDKLRTKKGYSLGYKDSEALLSMPYRTPNNTFPVFWCSKDSDGNDWPAPFFR